MELGRSLNVAVVDVDEAILDAIKMVLEEQLWKVGIYNQGNLFLRNLEYTPFDCVVLDPHLPDINGVEVVKHIKKTEVAPPVVVLTARPYSPQTIELKNALVHDILTKPISDIILVESIKSAVLAAAAETNHTDSAADN